MLSPEADPSVAQEDNDEGHLGPEDDRREVGVQVGEGLEQAADHYHREPGEYQPVDSGDLREGPGGRSTIHGNAGQAERRSIRGHGESAGEQDSPEMDEVHRFGHGLVIAVEVGPACDEAHFFHISIIPYPTSATPMELSAMVRCVLAAVGSATTRRRPGAEAPAATNPASEMNINAAWM